MAHQACAHSFQSSKTYYGKIARKFSFALYVTNKDSDFRIGQCFEKVNELREIGQDKKTLISFIG